MNLLRLGMAAVFVLLVLAPVRGDEWAPGYVHRPTDIDQKLKSIVVSVDFNNAKIDEALAALTVMSKQLDLESQGINFVIQPEASAEAQPITLKLDKVPVEVAVHYVCELSRVGYKVGDRFISITPLHWTGDELVKRTFHVEPSFVEAVSSAGVIPSAKTP